MKFTSLVRELESAGTLAQSRVSSLLRCLVNELIISSIQTYPFEFSTEKPYESYSGLNVRLRYFIRVTISRSYNSNVKEQEFAVQNYLTVSDQKLSSLLFIYVSFDRDQVKLLLILHLKELRWKWVLKIVYILNLNLINKNIIYKMLS